MKTVENKRADACAFRHNKGRGVVKTIRALWFATLLGVFLYGSTTLLQNVCRLSPLLFLASFFSDRSQTQDASLLSLGAFGIFGILSSVVLVACLFRRRFFCRYVCPLGIAVDAASSIRRKVFKNKFLKGGFAFGFKTSFAFFAVLWLVTLALAASGASETLQGLSPLAFDPMSIVSRTFAYFPKISTILVAFVILFVLSPYFWRFSFCPCGALQEALYLPYRLCQKITALKKRNAASPAAPSQKRASSRRRFFETIGAASICGGALALLNKFSAALKPIFFRPPGAATESDFAFRCARCGRCVKACPNNLLRPIDVRQDQNVETSALQLALLAETPIVDFSDDKFCEKDCVACSDACPVGAISILDKASAPIALAKFDVEKCRLYYGRECSICRRECPYEAIAFVWSEDAYANVPSIDADVCVGCGRCVAFCPGEPLDDFSAEEESAQDLEQSPSDKALTLIAR